MTETRNDALSDPVLEVVPKMSEMQNKCLDTLFNLTMPQGEMCVPFAPIERETGLARRDVRRSVRSLARKGLAEFHFPLWSYEGEPRGAGYCISSAGCKIIAARQIDALRASGAIPPAKDKCDE